MANARTRSRTPRTTTPHAQHTRPAAPATRAPRGVLRTLGIVGFDALEPVILAALATETPLLLIGPHGTAKSLLLTRLCEALGLLGRHYNASLVNYDDLIGYPLPDDAGRLRFVQTPASVWDAEAVFIDELSRARADMLNRLFPIIHERKVQGIPLERLRFRWAAMNPPANPDDARTDETYLGSEALDPALADRFGFVVEVPAWTALRATDQLAVITGAAGPVDEPARRAVAAAVDAVKRELILAEETAGTLVAGVVRDLMRHAASMRLALSGRRAAMIYRNILAVHAARCCRQPAAALEESSWIAVSASIPQRAQGVAVDLGRLLVAHSSVWKTVRLSDTDPRRILACEPDPVRRAVRSLAYPQLPIQERSAYVADGLAHLPPGGRQALGHALMESGAAAGLVAAVAEQCASLFQEVARAQDLNQLVTPASPLHDAWKAVVKRTASLPADDPEAPLVGNLLAALFARGDLQQPRDVDAAIESWNAVRAMLPATVPDAAAPGPATTPEITAA